MLRFSDVRLYDIQRVSTLLHALAVKVLHLSENTTRSDPNKSTLYLQIYQYAEIVTIAHNST